MRRRTLGPIQLITALVAALQAAPALAATPWVQTSQGSSNAFLLSVHSPDRTNVFAAGGRLDTSGMIPKLHAVLLGSSDGGGTFSDLSAPLGAVLAAGTAVWFLDGQRGFLGLDSKLYRTLNRGGAWASADAGTQIQALHFHDALHGVVGGKAGVIRLTADGGLTFTSASVPAGVATAAFGRFFFLDDQHGWATGYDSTTQTAPASAVVLATSDGGHTWTATGRLPSDVGLGPIFFLAGGRIGWVAGFKFVQQEHADARLFKTIDGGATWADAALPLQVGTVKMPPPINLSMPVNTSFLQSLYFADSEQGHLGGSAFVGNQSSSGGGGGDTIYKTVDYVTVNGGATWQKTDLGAISLTSPPGSDGQVAGGLLTDLWTGWMCGGGQSVFRYRLPCQKQTDCGAGYACSSGVCVVQPPAADGGTTGPDGGTTGPDGGSAPADAGSADAGGSDGGSGAGPGSVGKDGASGCATGGGLGALFGLAVFGLRRSRGKRREVSPL